MLEKLEITWETDSTAAPIVRLKGRLDAAGAEELRTAAMGLLKREGHHDLVVDLSEVEFIASTGLATFLLMTEEYTNVGGTIVFTKATPVVMQVVSLLNLGQFLKVVDSEDEAFALIGS